MASRPKIGLADVANGKGRKPRPLLAPLRYLRISAANKWVFDFIVPGVTGCALWLAAHLISPFPAILGGDGVLQGIQDLLTMAVPFLIGALATVAMSSPSDTLDNRPVGAPLILDGKSLSTRQFVCYLLGYLSFSGFILLILLIAIKSTQDSWLLAFDRYHSAMVIMGHIAGVMLACLISSFVVTVLWSLYFLTDVINRR